jgi:4-amino-4-deoxy-L-arabinose transferase-like glycosyltransferase
MSRVFPRVALALLLLVSAVLIFTRLDDRDLWEDEAENALLGERVLTYGIPIARDGVNTISQGCGYDATENYLWTYHAWLPMYLVAASFELFGVSTLAARLPFAILGWLSVLSIYVLARRLYGDRILALLAATFVALSVPFLLHVRQSRYYAIAVIAAVWMIYFFVGLVEDRRGALIGFLAASTAMFHALHPLWAATVVGLMIGSLVLPVAWTALARPIIGIALTLVANVTWVAIYGSGWLVAFAARKQDSVLTRARTTLWGVVEYASRLDIYVLPAVLILAFVVWLLVRGRSETLPSVAFRTTVFLFISAIVCLGCVSVLPFAFFRYMLTALPALAIVEAYMLRTMFARRPIVVAALSVLLVGTDVLHGWSRFALAKLSFPRPAIGSPLRSYVGELTNDYVGPTKAIVTRLRRDAKPGDVVFISYGDLPLRFYTRLKIYGGQTCDALPPTPPDWLVARYFLRFDNSAPGSKEDILRMLDYVRHGIPWSRYEAIELAPVDIRWENIPEPSLHVFDMPTAGPPSRRLTLWKRVR